MKIGLVLYGSPEGNSGGYRYDRELVRTLKDRGHDVPIFSLPGGSYPRQLFRNRPGSLLEEVMASRPDVLIEDELCHPSLFLVNRRIRRETGIPLVALVHHLRSCERHPAPALALYSKVETAFLRSVDAFLFNGETTRRETERRTGRKMPFAVAPPGLEPHSGALLAKRVPPGEFRLLSAGALIPRKGLDTAAAALAGLKRLPWSWTIAGDESADPAFAARLKRSVKRLGIAERTRFAGFVPRQELLGLYSESHLHLQPSDYEGWGISCAEAMLAGCVPVASSLGGSGDFVRHGENGFLVHPRDVRSLTDLLADIFARPERFAAWSAKAAADARSLPGWRESMERASVFIESLPLKVHSF